MTSLLRQAWIQPPLYASARAAAAVVNIAGPNASGWALGSLAEAYGRSAVNAPRLKRAMENIAWCFPDWPESRVRRCAVTSHRHMGLLAAELALSPRLLNADAWPRRVEPGEVADGLRELLRRGSCVLITGHCGNWELLGSWVAGLGVRINALYRPLENRRLDAWIRRTRSRRGIRLIKKFCAVALLPSLAQRREPIAFIADQNAGERGLFVPFFDRIASTYKSIGLFALRHDTPILCAQARRIDERTLRHRVDIVDVILPEHWREQADPLFYVTARYRRAIETMVRLAPEQYLWSHRYWKSRPRHERLGKPFPPSLRDKLASLPWMTEHQLERIKQRSEQDASEFAGRSV